MRIVIVSTYYPFPPSIGGVETIIRQVAVELAKRGHEIHIVTSNLDVTTQKRVTNLGLEKKEGVIIHKLKAIWTGIGYARILKGLYEKIQEINPDIVHVHNLHPSLMQLTRWRRRLKYKLVAELHHPAICIESLTAKLALPLVTKFLSMYYKYIDVFIAHTRLERDWLMQIGIPRESIEIVRFPAIPDKLLHYPITYNRENTILFLGRIVKIKGVDILIKAFAKIRNDLDSKLVIVGPINISYFNKLNRIIKKMRLEKDVKFTGPLYDEEKTMLLRKSKILVLPSRKEYTGIVLLEAQALGTPVIATKVGALPENVIHGKTGLLVEPGDVNELAKAIMTLSRNKELWKKMSVNAREFAKHFTLERSVNKLERIYNTILHFPSNK